MLEANPGLVAAEGGLELREAALWFRALVEQIPAITYTEIDDPLSETGTTTAYVSPQVESILGYTVEEVMADEGLWARLTHPDDVETMLDKERRSTAAGEPLRMEYRMFDRSGNLHWFRDESAPVVDERTGHRFWKGVMLDITDLKRAEEEKKHAELRYKSLVESLPMMVFVDHMDDQATNIFTSPQAMEVTGYTAEEWMTQPDLWPKLIHPEDLDRVMAAHKSGCTTFDETYRLIRKDGEVIWVRDFWEAIEDDGGPMFSQGFIMDVTSQIETERILQESLERERAAAEQLLALDRMKSTLLRTLSYDMKEPLTAVVAGTSLLETRGLEMEPKQRLEILRGIGDQARTMDGLLNDLLDLDKLDQGLVEPIRRCVDLQTFLPFLVERSALLARRDVTVEITPQQIWVDTDKLERIVDELLSNAARHTKHPAKIWVRSRPVPNGSLLSVEDEGPGVADDLKDAIFEAFRQGAGVGEQMGMGVGLAFVRRFAELHGGKAWVEDRPGGGSSFKVFFPKV